MAQIQESLKKKTEIQFPSEPVHFSLQLPPIKCYLSNDKKNAAKNAEC